MVTICRHRQKAEHQARKEAEEQAQSEKQTTDAAANAIA
jgi:hypothetical protein